jgi:hypothetical protein
VVVAPGEGAAERVGAAEPADAAVLGALVASLHRQLAEALR